MRQATIRDLPILKQIWEDCFGDSLWAIESLWLPLREDSLVFLHDSEAAMLTVLPVRWQGCPAAYLYAVGTASARRGEGLCRGLMAEAEQTLRSLGYTYALLCPGENSLFDFYGKMGYETCFFADTAIFYAGETLSVRSVDPEEYLALRDRFAPAGVEYPLPLLRLQQTLGPFYAIGNIGCAATEESRGTVTIKELFSADPKTAGGALAKHLHQPCIEARIPGKTPFAMAKSLNGSPLAKEYLGLAFE